MHITGKIQKIWAFFLALIMLAAALALSVSAEDTRFDGKSWEEITEDFLAERGVNTDRITIGYENLVSGESGYFQGDQYMVACSVYKVPLNMVLSERVYNGEMDFDTLIEGIPYSYIEEHSIVHSSNEMAEAAQRAFKDYADYRAALCPLLGEDAEAMDYNFFHRNVFTARQIIHCLKMLYEDPERYPRVLDYMLVSNPADTLIASLRTELDVAHKYGFLEYEDHTYFNDVGIVYTEEPFALAVFTADLGATARIIADYTALMRDYTDYRTVKRAEEEAEAARLAAERAKDPAITVLAYAEPEETAAPAPVPTAPPETTKMRGPLPWSAIALAAAALALLIFGIAARKKPLAAAALVLLAAAALGALRYEQLVPAETPQPSAAPTETAAPYAPTLADAVSIRVGASATEEEILALETLEKLRSVDANDCCYPEAAAELQRRLPDCDVQWTVTAAGQSYDKQTQELDFRGKTAPDTDALVRIIRALPALRRVDLLDSGVRYADCVELAELFPDIRFIFEIRFAGYSVPSDAVCFSAQKRGESWGRLTTEDIQPLLRYCTDLVALDLANNDIDSLEGIENLEKLQVLFLSGNSTLTDISPLAALPELRYLECALCRGITDFSPLEKMANMEYLNVSYSPSLTDLAFLDAMPELKMAWVRSCGISSTVWTAAPKAYPDVRFLFWSENVSAGADGWRTEPANVAIRTAFANWQLVIAFDGWDSIAYSDESKVVWALPSKE